MRVLICYYPYITMLSTPVYHSLKNVPIQSDLLIKTLESYTHRQYHSRAAKLAHLEKEGDIIPLKKGLYVLNSADHGYAISAPLCSNHIYGPSYLSLQWALSFYDLIPEQGYVYTAITTKRSRQFKNRLGLFTYHQVSANYYSIGIELYTQDATNFLIASPEKALADTLLTTWYVPHASIKQLGQFLEEDLRMDLTELKDMDIEIFRQCAMHGRKQTIFNHLIKLIEKI